MQQSYGVAALTGKVPSTSAVTVVMAWWFTVEMPLLQTEGVMGVVELWGVGF